MMPMADNYENNNSFIYNQMFSFYRRGVLYILIYSFS